MKRAVLGAAVILLGACHRSPPAFAPIEPALAADLPASRAAGQEILARGGSAADAAIAAILAQGVENPANSGLGGGGFAVVWEAEAGRAYALDFRETAPAGASPAHYRGPDGAYLPEASQHGCYSVGVPGALAGLAELHARFGRLPWREVVEPARKLAEEGVTVPRFLAWLERENLKRLGGDPILAAAYLHEDGRPYAAGEVRKDPDLAATLAGVESDRGESLYRGPIAGRIEALCKDHPGSVTRADLDGYRALWREPIVFSWRGYTLLAMGPPTSGGALLAETLHVLEPLSFDRSKELKSWHLLAESMKHAFADRAGLFGDPAFVEVPVARLLSPDYAAGLRARVGEQALPQAEYGAGPAGPADHGTTHVSAIDARGNAVAITNSVNGPFGSGLRLPRDGVLLDDTIDDFSVGKSANAFQLTGSEKNAVAPGKRPVSSMTPLIVLERGRVRLVAGGSGGPRILTGTLQVALGVLAEGLPVQEAVDHPRIHDQWEPAVVLYEPGVPAEVRADLVRRGNTLKEDPLLGVVDAVELNPGASRAVAAVDHRKD